MYPEHVQYTGDSLLGSVHFKNNASIWKKKIQIPQQQVCRVNSNMYVMNCFNFVPGGSRWQSSELKQFRHRSIQPWKSSTGHGCYEGD